MLSYLFLLFSKSISDCNLSLLLYSLFLYSTCLIYFLYSLAPTSSMILFSFRLASLMNLLLILDFLFFSFISKAVYSFSSFMSRSFSSSLVIIFLIFSISFRASSSMLPLIFLSLSRLAWSRSAAVERSVDPRAAIYYSFVKKRSGGAVC